MHLWRTMKQPSWQQITGQRTEKDRDLDHAHEMCRDCTRVGGSTDVSSSYFLNKTDTTCRQIKMGMVAAVIIISLTKQTRHVVLSLRSVFSHFFFVVPFKPIFSLLLFVDFMFCRHTEASRLPLARQIKTTFFWNDHTDLLVTADLGDACWCFCWPQRISRKNTSCVSSKKTLYYWGHKCMILFKILESTKMLFF